jgi:hypothetical protein
MTRTTTTEAAKKLVEELPMDSHGTTWRTRYTSGIKIDDGSRDADEEHVMSHEEVRRQFGLK